MSAVLHYGTAVPPPLPASGGFVHRPCCISCLALNRPENICGPCAFFRCCLDLAHVGPWPCCLLSPRSCSRQIMYIRVRQEHFKGVHVHMGSPRHFYPGCYKGLGLFLCFPLRPPAPPSTLRSEMRILEMLDGDRLFSYCQYQPVFDSSGFLLV
jgi:hypothetical protein